MLSFLAPRTTVHAHCDLPCGVYDPAQARLEAESVKACMVKYAASDDTDFKARAVSIKEERSDLVKHHLWVLWTDYFKAPHFEKYPQLNTCSTRPPSWPAPAAPRAPTTSPWPTRCWPRSTRSPRSSGRPRRRELDRRTFRGRRAATRSPTPPEPVPGPEGPGPAGAQPTATGPVVRPARPEDVPEILAIVRELAEYERSAHEVLANEELLADLLFGTNAPSGAPAAHCHVVQAPDDTRCAGPGRHGPVVPQRLDLDGPARDLPRGPLRPPRLPRPRPRTGPDGASWRGSASSAATRGWSGGCWIGTPPPSTSTVHSGARPMDEWTVHRISGAELERLAQRPDRR